MISVIALVGQGAVDAGTAAGAIVLVPVGFAFSHVRRRKRNTIFKLFLAGAMFTALWSFIQSVRVAASVDDARVALAALFLWTQVLHSFDLPRRRDLAFSMVASLIVMAEAASLSLGSGFAVYLAPYGVAAGVWLYLSDRLNDQDLAACVAVTRTLPGKGRTGVAGASGPLRVLSGTVALVVVVGGAVFLAAPRVQGVRIVAPPFAIARKV